MEGKKLKGKVLFTDQTHECLPEALTAAGYECVFRFKGQKNEVMAELKDYVGLVCKSRILIDRDFLKAGTNLKFVARAGVGTEHIDLGAAEEFGIIVLKSPEGSKDAVGEHALGLLLGLMNNLMRAHLQIQNSQWIRKPNTGVEIKGKTVGILGYGNMGQAFAQRLCGFECKVIAYDKYRENYGDHNAKAVSLEELFENSDILSIHIPYDEVNHYFINKAFLESFKKNIWLVNTGRGLTLQTEDLVACLKSGKVLGAALDVLEYEEMSFDAFTFENIPEPLQYLLDAPNVVLAPHIAGWSEESYRGHASVLAEKILQLDI
ncbi:MAG: hydroxyacid dehydrogenase [Saprospiraceae bacterium]|nr:hydroxyacid dehydrogenase [Saprospiraceae bacterium]